MIDDLRSPDFSNLSHIWCHTGVYFRFWSRFVDPHLFAWSSPITRYASGWWFDFILSWFSDGAFLESFRQAHTFVYSCDFWMELSQAHGFPHHHFSGVHVRSFMHPHGVILELSGQIGYIWCHTGAYFPPLAMEAFVLSHIYYSFHHSTEIYCICFIGHYSYDFYQEELSVEHDIRVLITPLSMILQ